MDDPCWTTTVLTTTVHGRPLFDDHCSWTTPVGRPLFMDDHCLTTTVHGRPLFDDHCSWTTPVGRPFAHFTVQSKKTITWSTEVQIEKFKSLTSSSLMEIQFIRRNHYQIPFLFYPKTGSKVRVMYATLNVAASHGENTTKHSP